MKRLILILFLLPVILSCKKNEFEGERPDERLTKTLSEYNDLLSGAKYGWKAHLFPSGGGGFGFLFEFDGKNRVTMMADILQESAAKSMESSYRLRATILPSLYFDTYSYIHLLADPNPEVNNGTPGWGLYSDFEFSIMKVSQDTIRLKGNLLGSDLILVRASAEEQSAYKAGNLNIMKKQVSDFFKGKRFNYLETQKGAQLSTLIDLDDKTLSLSFDSSGTIVTKKRGFAFSGLNEMILSSPFIHEDLNFDKLVLDSKSKQLYIPNGNRKLDFLNSSDPIFPLTKMIGLEYHAIIVPMEKAIEGSGTEFNTRRNTFLTAAKAALAPGTTFPQMSLIFNTGEQLMVIELMITQNTTNYAAYYVFGYKKIGEEYQFKYEGPMNGNAELLDLPFLPITQGLTSGTINLNYVLNRSNLSASGVSSTLPGFKFIGDLQ
jgi:hypothetical protein